MSTPGAALVRGMAAGDRDALARFYDRYAPLAYALVLKIVRDRADAAKIVRDVFWDCWRTARAFDPERSTPEAWVFARARAQALDHMRAVRRRGDMLTPSTPEATADVEPEEVCVREDRGRVTRALEKLHETQREVIELAYYGGLSQTEIAARLKQPIGTVKARIRLGLERLRDAARMAP